MNALWRANITFGAQKHEKCDIGFCRHKANEAHCTCGQLWMLEDNICFSQVGSEYVLIYNFFKNLRPIIETFSPEKCFFVLEGHPQFRYDLYADYKANRITKRASKEEEMNKFYASTSEAIRLLQYLPITIAKAAHYECDDTIATLCENMKDEEIVVLSSDSDYIQLLQRDYKSCSIYNPIKKEYMEAPSYPYVIWKCLNGDKSDNIPALLKPKKALECASNPDLFKKFLSVEENRANFSINRQLIEFKNIPLEEIELKEGQADFDSLKKEFDTMKFRSITNDRSWNKFCSTFDCICY
jgi:5'-3' exonuclease